MPPRVTIDELPEQTAIEGTNYAVVQDSGVTKKMLLQTLVDAPNAALTAHITNPTGAHTAWAISAVTSGTGVDGPSVQAQLTQLAGRITPIVALTQAAYDALTPPDPNTLYVII